VSFVLRVGARYETPETNGLSHFLEHMLHRGTATLPSAHAQADALESLGATLEATTGVDHGAYTLSCPRETFDEATALVGEALLRPAFTSVDVERGIVREELAEERDERGRLVDPDGVARAALFGDHALGFPIVGTPRTLRSFGRDDLENHHRRHYTTTAAAIGVSGACPAPRATLRALERAFGDAPRGRPLRAARFQRNATSPALSVVRTPSHQIGVRVAMLAPGRRVAASAAAELLLRIVDDGNATRLYHRLSDELGLCYDVSAGYEPYDDVGLFDIAAEATEDGALLALEEILRMLTDLESCGPTELELEKAKSRARHHADRTLDQAEEWSEQSALALISDVPENLHVHHSRLLEIGRAEVAGVARRMVRRKNLVVALVGPVSHAAEKRARELVRPFEG